jgi:hypothetical protein
MSDVEVPQALRTWFVVHFWADMLTAIPLFFAPVMVLELFGWTAVDPFATRIVAAALFGIGIESWIGRNATAEAFRAMLNLKVIWSGMVVIGLAWSLLDGGAGQPVGAWIALGIFGAFHGVWLYWRMQLKGA